MGRLKSEAGFTLMELLIVMAILGFTMAAVLGVYQVTQRVTFFATAGEDAQLQGRAVLDRLVADFQLINSGRTISTGAITVASPTAITFLADYDNTLDSSGNSITVKTCPTEPCPRLEPGADRVPVSNATNIPCGSNLTLADGPIMEGHLLKPSDCIDPGNPNTLIFDPTKPNPTLSTWYPSGSYVRSVETVSYAWDGRDLCRNVGAPCNFADPQIDSQIIATGVTNFQLRYNCDPCLAAPPDNLDSIRTIRVQISVQSKSGDQTVTRTMQVTVRPRNFF